MKSKRKAVKKSRARGGAASRRKGHAFERACANLLKPIFPDVKRHLENQKQEAMGFDLDNTGLFKFQCKAKVNYSPITAIEEVQCQKEDIPALITKGDNKKPVVCLYLDDFIELLAMSDYCSDEITIDDF